MAEPRPEPDLPDDNVIDELSRAFGEDDIPDETFDDSFDGTFDGTFDDAAGGAPIDPGLVSPGNWSGGSSDGSSDESLDESSDGTASGASGGVTIAIGAEDDFVDTVYLDDELARGDDSAGTVFIDDDGSGDAIAPKDATSQGIEPRMRQRRIGVARAAGLRRLKWVAVVVAVLAVIVAGLAVLGSSIFSVEEVAVTGNLYTDSDALDEVVEDLEGTPVLLVDTGDAERRLEAIPWVEDARVRTEFPDRVTIEIRERSPVATMRGIDGLFRVLDREGRVLEVIEGQPVAVVLIAGPGTLDLGQGEFAPVGYASASSMVLKLTPSVRARTEAMVVTEDGSDLRLYLTRDEGPPVEVRFGSAIGDGDQIEKLVRLESRLEDLDDPTVTIIDVSTIEVTVL
ncbi:MAG: cell division protein FtsQ/DivIB [Ilumatobacteraceae bacterium]